jgi:hypothetical protein
MPKLYDEGIFRVGEESHQELATDPFMLVFEAIDNWVSRATLGFVELEEMFIPWQDEWNDET